MIGKKKKYKLGDFDYVLPKKSISQYPEKKRDYSKLMVVHRDTGEIEHKKFIGGRYSVLTDVGMLPAFLMGLKNSNFKKDLRKLLHNKSIFLKSFKIH